MLDGGWILVSYSPPQISPKTTEKPFILICLGLGGIFHTLTRLQGRLLKMSGTRRAVGWPNLQGINSEMILKTDLMSYPIKHVH